MSENPEKAQEILKSCLSVRTAYRSPCPPCACVGPHGPEKREKESALTCAKMKQKEKKKKYGKKERKKERNGSGRRHNFELHYRTEFVGITANGERYRHFVLGRYNAHLLLRRSIKGLIFRYILRNYYRIFRGVRHQITSSFRH